MIIEAIKLKGRPKKHAGFSLSYGQWLSLKQIGMVKVGGYLLKLKRKKRK